MQTYLVVLHNPAANPSEYEEEVISADDLDDAKEEALGLIARHPFSDVELVSVTLLEPKELYHDA